MMFRQINAIPMNSVLVEYIGINMRVLIIDYKTSLNLEVWEEHLCSFLFCSPFNRHYSLSIMLFL
jgi:hypothetical protein